MLRRIAVLVLLPVLAAPLGADPDAPLDLTGARILASAGWPQALRTFLPAGREVEPLTLPLPGGPLLILGLVDCDAAAREVATGTFGMKAGEDLGGGYVVSAKRDGDRPLAAILAADPAALMAARFELETFVPAGKEKEPRSVEVEKPDEQAGVRTAPGRRQVKPRFRVRAAAGLGPGESVLDVAAAHANRCWVNAKTTDRELAQLRDHGVEPVVVAPLDATMPRETLLEWQKRGVRRFVADLRRSVGNQPAGEGTGPAEALAVQQMAEVLRPGGLDEILVLPSSGNDEVAVRSAPPDLRKIPEARIGWTGPSWEPLEITRAQAERRAKEAGVPVVLVESWMVAADGEPLRIPSLPRGRAADLGDVLAGILVLPGPASADAVAAAWAPPTDPDASPDLGDLMGACVLNAKDGPTFLIESAACLEQMLLGRYTDAPWMRGLPQRLRENAASLPAPEATLLARWVPEPVVLDGRLDEPAWASAPPQTCVAKEAAQEPVVVRALSDGRRLVLGIVAPDRSRATQCNVQLWVLDSTVELVVNLDAVAGRAVRAGPLEYVVTRPGKGVAVEVALDRPPLRGDPYPTRQFPLRVNVSGKDSEARFPLRPAGDAPGVEAPIGALLVVR